VRKLTVSIHTTVNGVVTGPPDGDETEWTWAAPGIQESLEVFWSSLANVDTFLLGHATYDDLVRKWPNFGNSGTTDVTAQIADKINTTPKIVVSGKPLTTLAWGTFEPCEQLTGDDVEAQIEDLKTGAGGEIMSFGSPTLVQSLMEADLVDEFQLITHPVVVPKGRRLFDNLTGRTDLRLVGVDRFDTGAMRITYAVERR
jgi:dihydrofolate reductase